VLRPTVQQVPYRADAFHELRDGPPCSILIHMIKETIPKLQKLSPADKFALAVELWDE
jgi:hypothetical protein